MAVIDLTGRIFFRASEAGLTVKAIAVDFNGNEFFDGSNRVSFSGKTDIQWQGGLFTVAEVLTGSGTSTLIYAADPPAALPVGHWTFYFFDAGSGTPVPNQIDIASQDYWHLIEGSISKAAPLAAFKFPMVDSSNQAPKTGLTVAGQIQKDDGSFAAISAASISEVGLGTYKVNLAGTQMDADFVTLVFTATGAQQTTIYIKTDG